MKQIGKIILTGLLVITLGTSSFGQFMVGPNLGYASGSYYKNLFAGVGIEYGYLQKYRIGLNIDMVLPKSESSAVTVYANSSSTTPSYLDVTSPLKYNTKSFELSIKRFFGRERENAYKGFYLGAGFSYKLLSYKYSVGDYDQTNYSLNSNEDLKGNIKHPFIDFLLGYEFPISTGMAGVELKACLPANQVNNQYIDINLPTMLKIGVYYRFGKFDSYYY